jgi:putative transposase
MERLVKEGLSVERLSDVLEVSRSGFYSRKIRPESFRAQSNAILSERIKSIHTDSDKTYGLPRIKATLESEGQNCGKGRIANLMKIAGISGLLKKRYRPCTTDSNHSFPIAERIFKTECPETHPTGSNQQWVSDISYIPTDEGFLYLATYMDLFNRKIVGFSTADHMRTELVLDALDMALGRQTVAEYGLLAHSDRGSQYASDAYQERLNKTGIQISMSRKGNCWDNAYAESFFATLKKELVYRRRFRSKEEARKAIFEYIEVWYNRKRLHSSIGYKTPTQFEEELAA